MEQPSAAVENKRERGARREGERERESAAHTLNNKMTKHYLG